MIPKGKDLTARHYPVKINTQHCLLPPATKLGQGYVFTRVCDSVHRGVLSQHALQQVSGGGECAIPAHIAGGIPACLAAHLRGGLLRGGGGGIGGAWWRPPGTATAAGGMHPTGMHSCFHCWWLDRVTLVVILAFCPNIFGRWQGPTNRLFAQK